MSKRIPSVSSTPTAPRVAAPGDEINQAAAYGVQIKPADVPDGGLYWKVVSVRHLSADENRGKHNVFVRALDEHGARVREPAIRIGWTWEGRRADERADPRPLGKGDSEWGHGVVDLFKHQRTEVWLDGGGLPSGRVSNLHTDHEAAEKTTDGQDGNTRFHHSFQVTFQRTRKQAAPLTSDRPGDVEQGVTVVVAGADNGMSSVAGRNAALFVREADDVPDGTMLRPGDRFSKTWVLRNTGATTWGQGYRLTWVGGDRLGAPPALPVPPTSPGGEAYITVDFTVPQVVGRQRSTWQLADDQGRSFGDHIWAEIDVVAAMAAPETGESEFAPPVGKRIGLPSGAGPIARAVAQTWNRYGGLILQEAERLEIDPAAAVAVLVAESRGEAFANGRMTIRFENHLFYEYWGKDHPAQFNQHFAFDPARKWTGHLWRADPDQPMQPCHVDNRQEWDVLTFARRLDDTAALKSVSMGAAQIMGFNHAAVGYATPQAMLQDFERDAGAQLRTLFRFMEVNALVEAVRRQDYRQFARVYNGTGQADHYAGLMHDYAAAFADLYRRALAADEAAPRAAAHDEQARTPQPTSPKPGVPLSESDPELYAAWREHIANGFRNNDTMFQRVLEAFMNPYWTTVWMYRVLFGVGVAAFVMAAIVALIQNNVMTTLIFGGLSVAAFLGYFVSRPLQALEENLQFITWLGIIYNTYWGQLMQAQDPASYAQELDKATDTAISRIQVLMNKHAERSGARPSLDMVRNADT